MTGESVDSGTQAQWARGHRPQGGAGGWAQEPCWAAGEEPEAWVEEPSWNWLLSVLCALGLSPCSSSRVGGGTVLAAQER